MTTGPINVATAAANVIYLAIWIAVCVVVFLYWPRYVYRNRIGKNGVYIMLFGLLPILRVSFNNIAEIEDISWEKSRSYLFALRFANRFTAKRCVVIKKKEGLFKRIIIAPSKGKEFAATVSRQIAEHGSISSPPFQGLKRETGSPGYVRTSPSGIKRSRR